MLINIKGPRGSSKHNMASQQCQCQEIQRQDCPTLPLLLLHRLPGFNPPILPLIETRYTVLDPLADPPDPLFPTRSKSVRIMICLGPTPVTPEVLDKYPAVECIVCSRAGVDHFDLSACRRREIRVTSAGDSFSDDAADFAVGLMIDVFQGISSADRFVRSGHWLVKKEYPLGSKVSGKQIGIVGLGSIGSRVAKRLKAFGCSIAYTSRKMKPNVHYTYHENILDLAASSNVLILCCALTDETYHVVNKDVMTALGKDGVVINVGRGAIIDEKELVQSLMKGEIGGAGLDVFENEPNVPKELLTLDNVVLTPHRAVLTPDSFAAIQDLVLSNVEAFFLNKPLQGQIELE